MPRYSQRFTPLMWFILALCVFELLVRLPYLIWLADNVYVGYRVRFHYFASYDPWTVIRNGTFIVLATGIAALIAHSLAQHRPLPRIKRMRLVRLRWPFYAGAIGTCLATLFGIYLLGASEIAQNISAKRDLDEIDAGVLLYLLLKISLFSHVLATLAYMAYLGSGRKGYLALLVPLVLLTMAVSIIFSQRALLFALAFEIVYVTYLYRGLNARKLLTYTLPFAFVLVGIGALRAIGSDGASIGDAALVGIDKVMSSRYFLNISKVGTIYEWQRITGEIDFLALNFLVEPFAPDETVYFKDVGRLVGAEIFGMASSGVTLGLVSEYLLSFGAVIASLFVFATFFVMFTTEKLMLKAPRPSIIAFFALTKVPILLNTSLGSFIYQTVLETLMLLVIIPGLSFAVLKPVRKGPGRMMRAVPERRPFPANGQQQPVSLRR
tara:strand:+ start:904 stop:2214 length:1311 start_codon:yes stop_codon:yes gene_type:complete